MPWATLSSCAGSSCACPCQWACGSGRGAPAEAVGEVSAEQFCPYPPGVPLLAPGERVTQESVDAIIAAGKVGRVAYSSDPTLQTIEVIEQL